MGAPGFLLLTTCVYLGKGVVYPAASLASAAAIATAVAAAPGLAPRSTIGRGVPRYLFFVENSCEKVLV